jgi:glycosyltransferase involved in cell wall biosynthesis
MGYDASPFVVRAGTPVARPLAPAGLRHAAMIGNYPPRKCGIATFTRDAFASLRDASPLTEWTLIAMDDVRGAHAYPPEVTGAIPQDDSDAYVRRADELNRSGAEIVFIQHEFGIFGGDAGSHLLLLLRRLRVPAIVTLHTVLEKPSPAQKRVMDEMLGLAAGAIVMSRTGKAILTRTYTVDPAKIHVIPHGAPERPFASPEQFKEALSFAGRQLLMTFGLLSPNKGLEVMIRGLPVILERHPDALYLVVGATHPHLVAREGEAYRDSLVELATSLGVANNLRFINRFVDDAELIDLLRAADIYVTPYLTEAQITSGTLSYAIALGKPVVSTPYWHAKEALANGVGVLCGFGDEKAFASEIIRLLSDNERREAMAIRAWRSGEPSRWRKVAGAKIDLALACRSVREEDDEAAFHALCHPPLTAIQRMTDDCGIIQHGRFLVPDRRHGYCVDDNARALSLVVQLASEGRIGQAAARLADAYAAFVSHAWNPDTGRFRNFMGFNRSWLDDGGSDDCCARAFEALCLTARHTMRPGLRDWAANLAGEVFPHVREWRSLRSHALAIKAVIAGEGSILHETETRAITEASAEALLAALRSATGGDWFEPMLSYDNARLPEALIIAGQRLERPDFIDAGLSALTFIMRRQTSRRGWFCPIATSAFDAQSAKHPLFDQQPIEALATVDACLAAWRATGDEAHAQAAEAAFRWFGGDNDHCVPLASPEDGGCFDALTADGVNQNQGAESILSYHLAALAMRDYMQRRSGPT